MAESYVVAEVAPAAEGVVTVTLSGAIPSWEPGAHVDLVLDGGALVRQYSLCGEPGEPLRVAVLREPGGRGGSRFVHDRLRRGDRVAVRGPRNRFPLVPAASYRFVAGGIGITPLLPMIRRLAASGADWRLLYGGRTRASMAFVEELEALGGDRVEVRPQDVSGLLPVASFVGAAPAGAAVYCCGPEPLLRAVEEACASTPSVVLRTERFAPKEEPFDAPEPGAFEVELASSGKVLAVPAGESLLSVLEDAGVSLDSSCREGTCGTCETAVLGGEPDHHDSLLTDDERAAGDVMFPCVSRARSARLILDL